MGPARLAGRDRELAALESLLEGQAAPRLAIITGPPGIGKSALVRELHRRAPEGRVVVRDDWPGGPVDVAAVLEGLADGCLLVITRRAPIDAAWASQPWFATTSTMVLEPLPREVARGLLLERGDMSLEEAEAVARWAAGLPVALAVASAARTGAGRPLVEVDLTALEPMLLDHLTAGEWARPDLLARERRVLAVAAIAPAVDADLLSAVLPEQDAEQAESWLRSLSFVARVGLQVALAPEVRRLLSAHLRRVDPDLERHLRLRIVDHLADGVRRPRALTDLREVAELEVDAGVAPSMARGDAWRVDEVRHGDAAAVDALLSAASPEHRRWVERWLREAAEHVVVVRRAGGGPPVAIATWATPTSAPGAFADDAVLAAWWERAAEEPSGQVLVNPITEVLADDAAEAGTLLLHAIVEKSGLPDLRLWLTTGRGAAPHPEHCGGVRDEELDLRFGRAAVHGWVLDYRDQGAVNAMRAQAHLQVGSDLLSHELSPDPGSLDEDVVREALRRCHDPVALANSPLARGHTVADRAASVVELLHDAVSHAFGSSPSADLQRQVLLLGYLDEGADHARAMRSLHLSRTTYFRRLREATQQLTAWLAPNLRPTP